MIGYVTTDLPAGSWVNETNLRTCPSHLRWKRFAMNPPFFLRRPRQVIISGLPQCRWQRRHPNILCISERNVAGIARHVAERIKKNCCRAIPNVDDGGHQSWITVAASPLSTRPRRDTHHSTHRPAIPMNETMVIGLGWSSDLNGC